MLLGAEHLLDHVAGQAVEEESNENGKKEEEDRLEDDPAVVVPQDVADRLQRVEEPDERRIRTAGTDQCINYSLLRCAIR